MPLILGVLIKTDGGARAAANAYLSWRVLGVTSMAATARSRPSSTASARRTSTWCRRW
jgi:hypothetical protein